MKIKASSRLSALTADALTDLQESVVDETASPPWFPKLRNHLAIIFGGTSKVKVIKLTPNSATFKFRAHGFILDADATKRLTQVFQSADLSMAVFTENQRLYLLAVESK